MACFSNGMLACFFHRGLGAVCIRWWGEAAKNDVRISDSGQLADRFQTKHNQAGQLHVIESDWFVSGSALGAPHIRHDRERVGADRGAGGGEGQPGNCRRAPTSQGLTKQKGAGPNM